MMDKILRVFGFMAAAVLITAVAFCVAAQAREDDERNIWLGLVAAMWAGFIIFLLMEG